MALSDKVQNMLWYKAIFLEDRDRMDCVHPNLGCYMRQLWVGECKNNTLFVPGMYFCILIRYIL